MISTIASIFIGFISSAPVGLHFVYVLVGAPSPRGSGCWARRRACAGKANGTNDVGAGAERVRMKPLYEVSLRRTDCRFGTLAHIDLGGSRREHLAQHVPCGNAFGDDPYAAEQWHRQQQPGDAPEPAEQHQGDEY